MRFSEYFKHNDCFPEERKRDLIPVTIKKNTTRLGLKKFVNCQQSQKNKGEKK